MKSLCLLHSNPSDCHVSRPGNQRLKVNFTHTNVNHSLKIGYTQQHRTAETDRHIVEWSCLRVSKQGSNQLTGKPSCMSTMWWPIGVSSSPSTASGSVDSSVGEPSGIELEESLCAAGLVGSGRSVLIS